MKSRLALLSLLILGALARSYAITRPWAPGDHNGWGGAFYSNIARNYLRYGLAATRGAPVITTGNVPPDRFVYYLTHPPFIGLTVAASFLVFGEHEWSARLVPLLFSLGSLVFIYLLGSGLWSSAAGLLAALIFAFVPIGIVYGAHVDPQGPPVTFLALAMLEAYRRRLWGLTLAALALGAGFDWPAHYMSGLLAGHALLSRDRERRWALVLPLVSVVSVGGFLAYARVVAPRPDQNYLGKTAVESFSFWSGREVDPRRIPGYRILRPGAFEWAGQLMRYYTELFTPPLFLLAFWGGVLALKRREAVLLVVLGLWGVLHIALFPMGAYVHDYWSDYLTPALSLAGGLGASQLFQGRNRLAVAVSIGLVVLWTRLGISRIGHSEEQSALLGRWLNDALPPEEGVLALLPLDVRDTYYADRPFRDGVNRLANFDAALADPAFRYRYFLVPKDFVADRPEKPLFQRVEATYPRFTWDGLFVYDLQSPLPKP